MNAKKNAIILCLIVVLIFAASLVTIFLTGTYNDSSQKYAYIYQDNKLIRTIDLNEKKEPYTFTVYGENGCYNTIEVKDGSIGVIESSCPDGLCMNMGHIKSNALPITCLPNRLIIEISNTCAEDGEFDGLAY